MATHAPPSSSSSPQHRLQIPEHVSALLFAPSGSLLVGSDDGSIRLYDLPGTRVVKAIRGLGSEVSSIVWIGQEDQIWAGCGRRAVLVDFGKPEMVQSAQDVVLSIDVGEDDEDVVNEIAVSANLKSLAFSTDGGVVGIVELGSKRIQRMKARHSSICGTVKFIPDRHSEMLSGGYDSALLHFDFLQGNVLSRYDFIAPPQTFGVSLSPPFVLSLALSPSGIVAAGTADGYLWIGTGGEKRPSLAKKKKSRKWDGLRQSSGITTKIAEGPIVAVQFIDATTLLTSTLLGIVKRFVVSSGEDGSQREVRSVWVTESKAITKVNCLATLSGKVAIGGFNKDGRGVVEVYLPDSERSHLDGEI